MSKKIDLQTIAISNVIVHDLPKHKKDDSTIAPNCSKNESKLSDGLRLFFKDKVVNALGSDKSFKICYDTENESPVGSIVDEMLTSNCSDLVESSTSIAKHLFGIQVGNNASGILVVIFGKLSSQNICILLKLERDKGAQLKLNPQTESYDIEEVQDLMLTQKTKIYKVALFILRKDFKVKFDGLIMDYQIDVKQKKEIVTYFIEKFLGCKAFEDPKVTTQKFFNYTRAFIGTVDDELTKAKYLQDLNSYMQKNSQVINPQEFADDYLKSPHKNGYKSYLESKKFSFSQSPKDIHFVENKIKKFIVSFVNDVSIVSNKGVFGNKVKMEKLDSGETRAVVTSRIKKIQ